MLSRHVTRVIGTSLFFFSCDALVTIPKSVRLKNYRVPGLPAHLLCARVIDYGRSHSVRRIKFSPLGLFHHYPDDDAREDASFLETSMHKDTELLHHRDSIAFSRRNFFSSAAAIGVSLLPAATTYAAGELDQSGQLFTPKSQMLGGGGSDAARGVTLTSRVRSISTEEKRRFLDRGGNIQALYSTRFITYLTRFLLSCDPAARGWWREETALKKTKAEKEALFSSFAESVEVGLADYFIGPYGSYASVQAAKAGLNAAAPANSQRNLALANKKSLFDFSSLKLFSSQSVKINDSKTNNSEQEVRKRRRKRDKYKNNKIGAQKQGIINLLALLQARYMSKREKIQLALLFSLISNPDLQPTTQISALLGEADNVSIQAVGIVREEKIKKKTQYQNGSFNNNGGYSITRPPKIKIEPPPALGTAYKCATADPIMRPTSRILRINVIDGGFGYSSPPTVVVTSSGKQPDRTCQATAILDRNGSVESIIVLSPGYGYTNPNSNEFYLSADNRALSENSTLEGNLPQVRISPPSKIMIPGMRTASAAVELEYEICGIRVTNGGNGYIASSLPEISVYVEPPYEDPDWILPDMKVPEANRFTQARVTSKCDSNNRTITSAESSPQILTEEDTQTLLNDLKNDPTKLLPDNVRPVYVITSASVSTSSKTQTKNIFTVPCLPDIESGPQTGNMQYPSTKQLYRTVDPILGGIGFAPVTKNAMALSASEYSRLGLSGAICTIIVRTLLNPLELVKTKIQLQNDKELIEFTESKKKIHTNGSKTNSMDSEGIHTNMNSKAMVEMETTVEDTKKETETNMTEVSFGTLDVISNLIELRGPSSLFQSADATFLASLVFGSLGFGATELFRRSFTAAFFENDDKESELVLLLAASAACVLTSFVASPFESMRVRSMGLVKAKSFWAVVVEFLTENRVKNRGSLHRKTINEDSKGKNKKNLSVSPNLGNLELGELPAFWGSFPAVVSRELPFSLAKFLVFDMVAKALVTFLNAQSGATPIQIGVGASGLAVSAFSGAIAGVAGAAVSHPADLILTLTNSAPTATSAKEDENESDDEAYNEKNTQRFQIYDKEGEANIIHADNVNKRSHDSLSKSSGATAALARGDNNDDRNPNNDKDRVSVNSDWFVIVQELVSKQGGISNLFIGFPARASFFFLVIGLQFFLYDYVKNLLAVGLDDLTLVLDVFYAVRKGLVEMETNI